MTGTSFRLSKYYFDCIGDTCELVIGYCARVVFQGIPLRYASVLQQGPDGVVESRTSLSRAAAPRVDGPTWSWEHRGLNLKAHFEPLRPAAERLLFERPGGSVTWRCLQPLSEARLSLQGREIAGLGYLELLEMTIPPWELSLELLRWGRFAARSTSLVWIDWTGPLAQTFVLRDGCEVSQARVVDEGIILRDGRLRLNTPEVLRSGPLASKALSAIPGISRFFPAKILQAHETKWRCRGSFEHGGVSVPGDVIHEVVRFGEGRC